MVKRTRPNMTPEVQAAVNDILHGTTVDSHTEWLQREYIRLMRREAAYKSTVLRESKLRNNASTLPTTDVNTREDRPTEQHSTEEHAPSATEYIDDSNRDA